MGICPTTPEAVDSVEEVKMAGPKKKHFQDMSDVKCKAKGCEKFIKQRIIDINPDADLCYACYMKLIRKNPKSGKSAFNNETSGG